MRIRLLTLVMGIFGLLAVPAGAATLTVSTTFDETNPGDGVCSLREAIQAVDSPGSASGDCAAAAFGANTIVLGANTYQLGGFGLIGATGLEISSTVKNLTIEGAGEHQTSINANALKDRAFQIDAGASLTIKDLTITSSTAPGGTAPAPATAGADGTNGGDGDNGGAILNNGSLVITDSAVINSHAGNGGDGGAGGASATVAGGKGGDGGNGGDGGGIYNSSSGTLTLNGASFSGDEAGGGGTGGAGGDGLTTGGDGGGGGTGGGGGAVANDGGSLNVIGSTLKGNGAGAGGNGGAGGGGTGPAGVGGNGGAGRATAGGGGLFEQTGTVTIANSTFASNHGGDGGRGGVGGTGTATGGNGGGGAGGGAGGAVRATNSSGALIGSATLAGNNAGGAGTGGAAGGGPAPGSAGTDGVAAVGGGIAATGGPVAVQDSILALNSGSNCAASSVTDGGHNIGFGDSSCPPGFSTGDPNLGPIQDNGGPSSTISLGPGSAAIDAVPATGAGCRSTDQRGVARPTGSSCDIGAYEVAGPQATTQPAKNITKTGAQLNANVTPNAGPSNVVFQIGTTTKYGTQWTIANVEGVTGLPVSYNVHGLKTNTTYHYRVTITTMDGSVTGTDVTFKTSITPTISGLKIKPSTFKAGASTTISYSDTQPATTTFVVQRKHPGKKMWLTVGSFTHTDTSGQNLVTFTGRVQGKKLKPGSYRFEVTPRAKGHKGRTVTLSFKIKG